MDACKRRVLHLLRNRPVLSRPGAMEPGFPVTGQATPERLLRLSSRSWVTERQQHSASSMTGAKDQPSASFDRTNASALKGFAASGSDGFLSLHEKYLRESELQRTYLDACLKAVEGNKYSSMYMTDVESVNFASVMAMESVNDTNSDRRLSPEDVYVKSKWHQQVQSEVRTAGEALQRHCLLQESALKRKDAVSIPRGRQMLNSWFPRLKERIEIEKETLMSRAKKSRRVPAHAMTSALINDLNSDQLAVITIQSVMGSMLTSSGQVMLSKIALNLGRAVQLQCNLELMRDRVRAERQNARQRQKEREARQSEALEKATKDGKDPEPLMRAFNEEERADRQHLNMRLLKWDPSKLNTPELSKSLRANLKNDMIDWDSAIVAKVGALLMKCLMDSAEVEVADTKSDKHETRMEPAFTHTIEVKQLMPGQKVSTNFRRYGMINVHPAVLSSMLEGVSVTDLNITRYRPMVIPPLPWTSHSTGGHLTLKCLVMRTRGDPYQLRLLEKADEEMANGGEGLRQVYNALNALSSVGWRVNKEMLDIVEEVWEKGGGIAGLPDQDFLPEIPPPEPRWQLVSRHGQLLCEHTDPPYNEFLAWKRENSKIRKKNNERHSLKCDMEYKLQTAREMRDEPVIYYPHNLDFRGRAYPMHPHLSHLGSDVCRALLQFSEAKPLGEKGLRWLFIQAANLYGANKMSLDRRWEFTSNNMDRVRASAADPLSGDMWWAEADEPWQLLAVCKEIVRAVDSGDPASFMSSLPVHQDGSCNGLQHYAALGRDAVGGRAVNLTDTDSPQDVYSGIAELVQAHVKRDAEAGNTSAKLLLEHVDRKLVKQTVMTSVYGVTFIGARDQIADRLRERGWEHEQLIRAASKYGATVTMEKLHEMFTSAKDIMNWLGNNARAVAASGHSVEWTTPLGLPVVQPYRKYRNKVVSTVLQRVALKDNTEGGQVMKQRQRTAFPPNYIHSIDSTHMMMTAIECRSRGLSFAGVHDSFWTHAGTIEIMNKVLREKFLELHSRPLLEELLEQLQSRFPEVSFEPVPTPGDLKLDEIHRAKYFFS